MNSEYVDADPQRHRRRDVKTDRGPDPRRRAARRCGSRSRSWPFLTFNSSVGWRETYWTESLDRTTARRRCPRAISGSYFDVSHAITGPGLHADLQHAAAAATRRSSSTSSSRRFTIQRVTAIDNFDKIVKLDGTDYVVGQVTQRRLRRRQPALREEGQRARDPDASRSRRATTPTRTRRSVDPQLPEQRLQPTAAAEHFSPVVAAGARRADDGDRRDVPHRVRHAGARAADARRPTAASTAAWVVASAGWSQRRFIPDAAGSTTRERRPLPQRLDTIVRKPGNALGGIYAFNYDLQNNDFLQQRIIAYYNAQCCGIARRVPERSTSARRVGAVGVPKDRRFNISFTLAGIGTLLEPASARSEDSRAR